MTNSSRGYFQYGSERDRQDLNKWILHRFGDGAPTLHTNTELELQLAWRFTAQEMQRFRSTYE